MLEAGGGGTEQKHPRNFTWRGKDRTIQFCTYTHIWMPIERLKRETKCDILHKLSP
jgi:hypothetical protein